MDRKGIGGFMEAMMAMMAVTITLTAFMGILAYADISTDGTDIDTSFLDGLRIMDGKIYGINEDAIISSISTYDVSGIQVNIDTIGDILYDSLKIRYGTETSMNRFKEGTVTLDSDDGRRVLAHYEVVVWY